MSILTEGEMNLLFANGDPLGDPSAFAREVESAVLEKLAGMELPEPEVMGWDRLDCAIEGYTATQLHQAFAQGAASQLAQVPFGYLCDWGNDRYGDEWHQYIVRAAAAIGEARS